MHRRVKYLLHIVTVLRNNYFVRSECACTVMVAVLVVVVVVAVTQHIQLEAAVSAMDLR